MELAHGSGWRGASVIERGVGRRQRCLSNADGGWIRSSVVIPLSTSFEEKASRCFGGGEKFNERVEREVEALVADRSWRRGRTAAGVPQTDLVGATSITLRAGFTDRARGDGKAGPFAAGFSWRRLRERATDSSAALLASLGFETVVIGNPQRREHQFALRVHHPEELARTSDGGLRGARSIRTATAIVAHLRTITAARS